MALTSDELKAWLIETRTTSTAYSHNRVDESAADRDAGLQALTTLVARPYAYALGRLAALAEIDLNPLGDSEAGGGLTYPDHLHTSTLQGYLGEIIAGVAAENFEPHDRAWEVPAFLFRNHTPAFQALERRRQLGGPARPIPGRTGDDCPTG